MPPNAKQDRIFIDLARGRGALDAKGAEALRAEAQRDQKSVLDAAAASPSFPRATLDGIRQDLERLSFACKKCGKTDLCEMNERPGSRELCDACSGGARASQRLGKPGESTRRIQASSSGRMPALSASAPAPADAPSGPRPPGALGRPSQALKAVSPPPSSPSPPPAAPPRAGEPPARMTARVKTSERLREKPVSPPAAGGGALEPPRKKTVSLPRDSQRLEPAPPSARSPTASAPPPPPEPEDEGVFLTHMADAAPRASAAPKAPPAAEAHDGEVFLTEAGGAPTPPSAKASAAPAPDHDDGAIFLTEVGGKPEEKAGARAAEPLAPNVLPRGTARKSAVSSRRTGVFAEQMGLADGPTRIAGADKARPFDADVDMAGAVIGGCRVDKLLGKGGMARVYLARHAGLDRKMAVKVLDEKLMSKPGFAEQFVAEARTLAKLDHPNIVRVFNVDKDPSGAHFIVMELLEGGSVDALWRKHDKKLPIDEAVRIAREAADGLFHAHRAGLIHRDVKPANLMLTADNRVKVVDFGLAVPTSGDVFVATEIAGTPVYMAPEQADGLKVDARCDQYALGVTLFQLLCGRPPFEGKRSIDVLLAHATKPPPNPRELRPDIPPWLEKGILTMLAKSPSARFGSLGDVIRLFQGQRAPTQEFPAPVPARPLVRAEDIAGLEKGLAPRAVAPPRWRPALAALAGCAALLVIFFLGPGREALAGSLAAAPEVPASVKKALARSQELAASEKPQDIVAALRQLEDEIADLGARARTAVLETERQALKEKLDGVRAARTSQLKEHVADLIAKGRFASAIDLADPEDKGLVALELSPLASELRDQATRALATTRNEVYVRAGSYFAGRAGQSQLKGFYIDRTEVTNEAWAKAAGKPGVVAPASWGGAEPPAAIARQPVVNVTFEEARSFAKAEGKRLPTTEEWEKAARGDKDSRLYPWGERFEAGRAQLLGSSPAGLVDVDAKPGDVSPYDVLGLAGNAAEWVTSARGPLVAGGGYRSHERSARVFSRVQASPDTRDPGVGFRCARDLEPAESPKSDEKKK